MYRQRQTVAVPPGMDLGQVIGKAGSNLKHLQARSGTRMFVDNSSESVIVQGRAKDVSTAVEMLAKQFESWRSSG